MYLLICNDNVNIAVPSTFIPLQMNTNVVVSLVNPALYLFIANYKEWLTPVVMHV